MTAEPVSFTTVASSSTPACACTSVAASWLTSTEWLPGVAPLETAALTLELLELAL